jgi:hypothetical protein
VGSRLNTPGLPIPRPTAWLAGWLALLVAVTASISVVDIQTSAASTVPQRAAQAVSGRALPAGWSLTWSTKLTDAGQPIAMSSPIPANLDGQPSVVVGDRADQLYAFHLGNPTTGPSPTSPSGWPTTDESGPIDSTPSIIPASGGLNSVLVGSGNDADPFGGYQAYGPTGSRLWFTSVVNPASDAFPDTGVQAGLTVGTSGGLFATAGSLGQVGYTLNAASGATLAGWPFFNSDSTHSTAALADLYGTGQSEIVVGGDQTAGFGQGQTYADGGHLRILTTQGNQICRADTNEVVDSSPAVGGILAGGATGIVVGTGAFFSGASDADTVKAYDTHCQLQWSTKVDGSTFSSPALSDVLGNGALQVVEGTDNGSSGSVWVLNAATGQPVWTVSMPGRVIGSVVTADLDGSGANDVIVPTTGGTWVFNGRTGATITELGVVGGLLGLQNSPLVTADPNGTIGVTLAGYIPSAGANSPAQGEVEHYEIVGNPAAAVGGQAWPMFHHDPQLTGDAGATTPVGSVPPCSVPAAAFTGYDLAASDGGVFSFGGMPFCGSTGNLKLNAPVVGMAMAPNTGGYWEVAADGGIFAFGDTKFFGSMGGSPLNAPIVAMAATPDGKGYWEVAADGGIFAFGDAKFYGSMGGRHLNKPIVGMSSSTDGAGYRLVASDGGIFSFGDAPFSGSVGGRPINQPVVGTANDTNTGGYWEVASDGGVFSFGGAPFYGSTGNITLHAPVVGMSSTSNGSGYRFVASDGGIFSFNAPFLGSMGGTALNRPVVGMAGF